MSIEDKSINSIVVFFHKLLGPNLWILPVAVAVGSWFMYHITDKWYLLYIAIICSVMSLLIFLNFIYLNINKYLIKKAEKLSTQEEFEHQKAKEERMIREECNRIWKYVAHLDNYVISELPIFLELDIHDDDKCVRYLKIPYYNNSIDDGIYDKCCHLVSVLTFNLDNYTREELIKQEEVKEILYFYIHPYLLALIENFKRTNNWVKI